MLFLDEIRDRLIPERLLHGVKEHAFQLWPYGLDKEGHKSYCLPLPKWNAVI